MRFDPMKNRCVDMSESERSTPSSRRRKTQRDRDLKTMEEKGRLDYSGLKKLMGPGSKKGAKTSRHKGRRE